MSMTLMLERIASDVVVATNQRSAVAEEQQASAPLQPFDGEATSWGVDGNDFFDDDGYDDDDRPEGEAFCLEKSWHGLHFLLTGDPWGGAGWRAFLLAGGAEQDEDMGYGPARRFEPNEVREIAKELDGISGADLWTQFDAQKMTAAEIYPNVWNEPEDELEEEYLDYFEQLKEFLTQTAEQGDALQIYLE